MATPIEAAKAARTERRNFPAPLGPIFRPSSLDSLDSLSSPLLESRYQTRSYLEKNLTLGTPWIVLELDSPTQELSGDPFQILPHESSSTTPVLVKTYPALLTALRSGMSRTAACQTVGLAPSTLKGWFRKAEQGEEPYVRLVLALLHAETLAHQELLTAIRTAGVRGSQRRLEEEKVLPDGSVQTTVKTIEDGPDWRAAAFLLERTRPEHYSRIERVQVQETGAEDSTGRPSIVFRGLTEEEKRKLEPRRPDHPEGGPGG